MRRFVFFAALFASAFGCSSKGDSTTPSDGNQATGPTFHENVESILQDHCQTCHHDGGIAPFSMTTYAQAKKYAALIADKATSRSMPPWGEAPTDECKPRFPISHDLTMSQTDIDTIAKWAANGAPEGDPAKAPPAKTFGPSGLPDPTDTLETPMHPVPPGNDDLRCFVVDPKLTEDTWVEGTNVLPGNSAVVHHAIVYVDSARESLTKADATGSYPCFGGPGLGKTDMLLAWAPGVPATEYPAGVGLQIKKDSLLVVQIHYHPTSDTQNDSTKIQLRRAKATPSWQARIALIGNASSAPQLLPGPDDPASGPAFVIPAGAKNHTETMEFTIPATLGGAPLPTFKLASVGTHMHWLGKDMKIDITRAAPVAPNPATECLMQTPRYDFNWQRGYAYDVPIDQLPTLGPGDKLHLRCTYDNTMDNPYVVKALTEQHLTAPVDVKLGETTLDEMCLGAFVLYSKL